MVGANQEMAWKDLEEQKKNKLFLKQLLHSANRGGLICYDKWHSRDFCQHPSFCQNIFQK